MGSSLLPSNATSLEKAIEEVMALDESFDIRALWNVSECPEDLLYILAFTLSVDQWDETWSRNLKEQALLGAYEVHSQRGTPASIRRVFRNSGFGEIDIAEGLNIKVRDGSCTYNGHFYHYWEQAWAMYRVYLQQAITNEQADRLRVMLEDIAPLHTELKGLHFNVALFTHNASIVRDGQYNYGVA